MAKHMQVDLENQTQPQAVLAVSPGIAIGKVRIIQPRQVVLKAERLQPNQLQAEQQRLQTALEAAQADLNRLKSQVAQTVGAEEAAIFEAQQLMLQDPDLLSETRILMQERLLPAAAAWQEATEQQAQLLETLDNAALAARAADLRDAAGRVIQYLLAEPDSFVAVVKPETPVILVAYDLTPSDTANLNPAAVLGICTVVGGPTTHAAILARALEIPAVAGIDPQLLETLTSEQWVGLDGDHGLLYLRPSEQQQAQFQEAMEHEQARRKRRQAEQGHWRREPATTADGFPAQVFANVGDLAGARAAARLGAEGVGLLRTEFLFNNRTTFPTEQEQFESYNGLFTAFAESARFSKIVVARTLDAGADKPFPALDALIGTQTEANPALGVRGIRIHLRHAELLRQQLRALLRAAASSGVELQIMFPMITTLDEVRRLKTIYAEVWQALSAEISLSVAPKLGIMIETPAAAILADLLAREVDFLSIGANDLYQYTLAADRTNSQVMSMFGKLEPAIWRLLDQIVRAAHSYGKPVAVCGELAADPQIGPLLIGLGVHELSMSPPAIERVKAALHAQTRDYWREEAARLLSAETAEEMEEMLRQL